MSTPTPGLSIQVHHREEFLAKLTSVDQLVFLCGALAISLHVDVLRAAMEKLKQNIPSQKSFYSALAGYLAGVVSPESWTDAVERCVTLFKIKVAN